ncbi:MAG: hypothetical protein VX278_22580 [Myxococcota bacterium]|nr:hypothetical protein [Myxococcota bacterium]
MKQLRMMFVVHLFLGCTEKDALDTADDCSAEMLEWTESITMTNDEYTSYLSEDGELTEESCNTICEFSEAYYTEIVGCELTGQATGDPENPPTSTVDCAYQDNPC